MMKTVCKKYQKMFLSAISAGVLLAPLGAFANRDIAVATDFEARQAEMKSNRQEAFCNRFTAQAEKITSNLTNRLAQFDANKKKTGDLGKQRTERETSLAEERSTQDTRRVAMYQKLEGRAKTDKEKAAVATFKKTVEEAIATRRSAVDAAIKTFLANVDSAVSGRKDVRENAVSKFKSAVEAALSTAQAGCTNGAAPESVRATFKSDLQTARKTLETERQGAEKVGSQVKAFAETRRAAVKSALDTFKKTVEAARADLKKAFGETVSGAETAPSATA